MKILVDKLPEKKEDCIFCIINDYRNTDFHKCLFSLDAYDYGSAGATFDTRSCALTKGQECPYLKEVNNG